MARILVVEDDGQLRGSLARLLARSGYEVIEAENGRMAMLRISQHPIDLVVTDMLMPEMEGVETIRALRQCYPGVKIIAISGGGLSSAENYLRLARTLGSHKILIKPLDPQLLLDAVRELVGQM